CNLRGGRIGQTMLRHIVTGHFGSNGFRRFQAQSPPRGVDHMAKPIADGARAEVHPTAPLLRNPKRTVRDEGHRSDPKFVVEFLGNLVMLVDSWQIWNLAIDLLESVTRGVDGMHLANRA